MSDCFKSKLYFWLGFIGIVLISLFVYYPSFFHIPRSDQIIYFANTSGMNDWLSLAIKTYSYDRVPHIFEGLDAVLFRPFFFFILGTEKHFFGNNFMAWQVTGFCLHMFVIWNLLRLLWRISPGILAVMSALCFSIMLSAMEMVVWQHVNGYLIFLSSILISLDQLYRMTKEKKIYLKSLIIIAVCLLVATSTYELGLVYSVLFFLYLFTIHPSEKSISKWSYLFILLPGVLYFIVNLIDLHSRGLGYGQGQTVLNAFYIFPTLKRAFLSMYWFLYAGLFPGHLDVKFFQRTIIQASYLFELKQIFNGSWFLKTQVVCSMGLLLTYGWQSICNIFSGKMKGKKAFTLLVILMLLAQMTLIVMARINFKELSSVLAHNSYYGYYFWLYAVVILFCFISFKREKKISFIKVLGVICLIGLTATNGYYSYQTNQKRAKVDMVRRILVNHLEEKIKEYEASGEGFSFFLDPQVSLKLPWVKKVGDQSKKEYTFLELLYPHHFDRTNPRYIYKFAEDGLKIGRRY